MKNSISVAPQVELKELANLFIELTAKNCNLKCKHCYLELDNNKKVKDFIHIDKVKKALQDSVKENVRNIYLTGGEPMLHPDFNTILRMCLKKASTTIMTNGMCINDKKARFLRKVEDEFVETNNNEIIFKLSIDHYLEKENDDLRGRGSYRKSLHALKSLTKYGFNPILSITNYYKLDETQIETNFEPILSRMDIDIKSVIFTVQPCMDKTRFVNYKEDALKNSHKFDCATSRILTAQAIYNCPLLANDHRARSGASLENFTRRNYLETELCTQCIAHGREMFVDSWT